jgi:uncharacterized protein YegL
MEALLAETRQSQMNSSARTNGFGSSIPHGMAAALALLLFAPLLFATQTVSAQEAVRISIDQVVVAKGGDEVTAFVSVLDEAGRPVLGLADFDLSVDGSSVPLRSAQPVVDQEAGIAVLLLLDISGSMEGEPLEQAKGAAASFVEQLLPPDVAAVATFAGTPPSEAVFAGGRDALLDQIAALEAEGQTVLYDAVVNGLTIASNAPTARRAVVLLTDGQDSGAVGSQTSESALQAAATSSLPVYAIGLGTDADEEFLRSLAESSGGAFYAAPGADDVPAIFDAIAVTLRSQYALAAALPPAQTAERELVVRVNVDGAVLTARAGFADPNALVAAGDGGQGPPSWALAAAAVAAAVLVMTLGFMLYRRRGRRKSPVAGGPGENATVPDRPQTAQAEPIQSGRLTVVAGPNAGTSIAITSAPIDIGSDPACGLRLDAVDGAVGATHARVWLQSGRLMLHHLARRRETLAGGRPVEWASLEQDDTIQIGPHVISFALDNQ